MNKETSQFLSEGMAQYKSIRAMTNAFNREIISILQGILRVNRKWGNFVPDKDPKIKSTTYGTDYPVLNAWLPGKYQNAPMTVEIAINWYSAEGDYPFYYIRFYNQNLLADKFEQIYGNQEKFVNHESGLKFFPERDSFDLERDFELLINEFVKVI